MSDAILDYKKIYKIPKFEWPQLRDLYRRNWPRHILSFYTLKTYIGWIEENNAHEIIIYTTDENWKRHGTYVLVEINGPRCNVMFNTLHASNTSDLILNALKCLQKDGIFTLAAFVQQVKPAVDDFLQHLDLENYQNCICDTLLYYLPIKEALQLATTPKAGYHLKPLTLDDASLIDSLWPHRYPGSEEFIRSVIRNNLTLGAYEESSGKLCAWVLQEKIGTIGLLQVIDEYKRNGLGQQLVRQMAVLMAKAGMDATATVMCTNRPLRHLFQKLSFKIIDRVYWYNKKPKNLQETNNENPDPTISQLLLEVDCV